MRYLGIDYGHKKVGLAISDEMGSFAFPYQVMLNKSIDSLTAEIKKICLTEGVREIVLGESLDLSGEANPIQKDILIFKKSLEENLNLPVSLEREFFTTWEAKRIIDESQTDKQTDARAAALILKSYLDKNSR